MILTSSLELTLSWRQRGSYLWLTHDLPGLFPWNKLGIYRVPWPWEDFHGSSVLVLIKYLLPEKGGSTLLTLSRKCGCSRSDLSLILMFSALAPITEHSHLFISSEGAVAGLKVSVHLSPGIQEGRMVIHSLLGSDTCADIFVGFLSVEKSLGQSIGKEERFLSPHCFRHFSLWPIHLLCDLWRYSTLWQKACSGSQPWRGRGDTAGKGGEEEEDYERIRVSQSPLISGS